MTLANFNDSTQTIEANGHVMTYEAALQLVMSGRDPLVAGVGLDEKQKAKWMARLTQQGANN
ncbi:MAG: hypothetical protein K0Q46_2532 [Rhodococcus erythropolis]|jgi:hypothetical protein|nr:hypothetical protein [Rhodococcus erythropolis]MDF2895746.1 hypothetical protein [Rhodococcus erythropolis]